MVYSNNYSSYIEKLKMEKNKEAFKRVVESTKENKTQKIFIEDQLSEKRGNNVSSQEESFETKDRKSIYVENATSRKSNEKVSDNYSYSNPDEYSAVTTEYRVDNLTKSSEAVNVENDFSIEQQGKYVKNVESYSDKSESLIDSANDYSEKSSSNINSQVSLNQKEDSGIVYEYSVSEKSTTSVNPNNTLTAKSEGNITQSIIDAIKSEKAIAREINNGAKINYDFNYLVAKPTKKENIYPGISVVSLRSIANSVEEKRYVSPLETSSKAEEEKEYAYYADKYKYYPAGSYSQVESTQKEAFSDVVKTIINPSNWSTPGSTIVSGIKIATDIVDMLSIAGPSSNIYNSNTANNLRKDLTLKPELFANGRKIKEDIHGVENEIGDDYQKDFIYNNDKADLESNLDELKNYSIEELSDKQDNKSNFNETKDYSQEELSEKNKNIIRSLDYEEDANGLTSYEVTEFAVVASTKNDNKSKLDELKNYSTEELSEKRKDELQFDDGHAILKDLAYDNEKDDNKSNLNETKDYSQEELSEKSKNIIRSLDYEEDANGLTSYEVTEFAYESEKTPKRWFDDVGAIGKIYVIPPYNELSGTSLESTNNVNVAFTIPLQNNLQFEQTSRPAAWTALQFFGRIGDVQQYSRTGSLEAITLTTKYFIESNKPDDIFNMRRLQDIEMMYRSLVLPITATSSYLNDDNKSDLYYFTRPPLINIVLGKVEEKDDRTPNLTDNNIRDKKPYKNLFTDVVSKYNPNKKENNGYTNNLYYKNFVVTNVTIDKNQNDYNYYVEGSMYNGDYLDTTGFTVTLTILEIDENYLGSMPSFNNYYNTLKQGLMGNYIATGE